VEILVAREALGDQLGADYLAVALDQAAIGLVREGHLSDPGNHEWIDESRQQRERYEHDQGGTQMAQHGGSP